MHQSPLGLDVKFASAGDARQALLQLPSPDQPVVDTQEQSDGAVSTPKRRKWRYWLLSLLTLPLLGAVLWCIWPKEHSIPPNDVDFKDFNRLPPSFNHVTGLEPGTYPYISDGIWKTALDKKPVDDHRTMRTILTSPRIDVAAVFKSTNYMTQPSLVNAVLNDNPRTQFAVMDLVEQLPTEMDKQVVGYDGLLVYVPVYKVKPITPEDNLCMEGKQPFPNVSDFKSGSYPLSVPLIVAYPKDNRQPGYQSGPIFANLLRTQYGQYLLQQAGLVPLQPIPVTYQPSEAFANH